MHNRLALYFCAFDLRPTFTVEILTTQAKNIASGFFFRFISFICDMSIFTFWSAENFIQIPSRSSQYQTIIIHKKGLTFVT